ncbi:adenylate kinase [Quaeritorhiza haematococci]|nr:adenylate kinase [Quaeritorhiza haematococci]
MKISDSDLLRRRMVQKIDPRSGNVFPGAQIAFSIAQRGENQAKGRINGLDDENKSESEDSEGGSSAVKSSESEQYDQDLWNNPNSLLDLLEVEEKSRAGTGEDEEGFSEDQSSESDNNGGDDEEDSGSCTEDSEAKKSKKKQIAEQSDNPALNLAMPGAWRQIPSEVLDRLVQRPEDMESVILESLQTYAKTIEPYLEEIINRNELFPRPPIFGSTRPTSPPSQPQHSKQSAGFLQFVEVDASQTPGIVFRDVMSKINNLSVVVPGINNRPFVEALKLELPEGTWKGLAEEDLIRFLTTHELQPGEPPHGREISATWGRFCPVTYFREHKKLVMGKLPEYTVAYRGSLYFLATEEYMNAFISNPDKYLLRAPSLPNLKICILGGPFSGKTTQSKLLSTVYGLRNVSTEEIMTWWDRHPDQAEVENRWPLYQKIKKKSLRGKTVPADLLVSVLQLAISGELTGEGEATGWIIDGFPRTIDQANAMIKAGLVPDYTIILENDINDLSVRSRMDLIQANSLTGLTWESPQSALDDPDTEQRIHQRDDPTMPPIAITMFPYFDNLYNGFKEEYKQVLKILQDAGITVMNPISAELAIPTVLSQVQGTIDPFLPKASVLPANVIADLPDTVELGYTRDYCPVMLKKRNILSKGVKTLAVRYQVEHFIQTKFTVIQPLLIDSLLSLHYQSHLYYFSSEEARQAFAPEPHNFVTARKSMKPPPFRVMMLGPKYSGKTSCCKVLEKSSGAPHVDFDQFMQEFAARQTPEYRKDIEYMIHENAGILSVQVVLDVLQTLFGQEPYKSRGFILEGFPRSKLETDLLIKHGFHVDALVVLKVDSQLLANRILKMSEKKSANRAQAVSDGKAEEEEEVDDMAMLDEYTDNVDKEATRIQEVVASIEALCPVPVIELDANRCLRPIIGTLKQAMKPYIDHRPSLFSNAYKVDEETAEEMLRVGIKSFSQFWKHCPVSLHNNQVTCLGHKPVVYRDQIYFCSDEQARDELIGNTLTYVNQDPPKPIVRPTCVVLGRPKSGKTTLAKAVARDLQLVYLSIPIILQNIVDNHENTNLHDEIKSSLERGQAVREDLVSAAVISVLQRDSCQSKGWVLDGYPQTESQCAELAKYNLVPFNVIHLELTKEDMVSRCEGDYSRDLEEEIHRLDIVEVVQLRDGEYQKRKEALKAYFESQYANWVEYDGHRSKWALKKSLQGLLHDGVRSRRAYFNYKLQGKAAPIAGIGLSLDLVSLNMGKFRGFCPVHLKDRAELVKGALGTQFVAEYKKRYYRMADSAALEKFLSNPDHYLAHEGLPSALPVRRSPEEVKKMFPKQIELQGYCPVSIANNPPGQSNIFQGVPELTVEYAGKLYMMASEDALDKFMRTPWTFSNLSLPSKLPPKEVTIPLINLPIANYLELTVANILTDALTAVGKFKPKYPYKSIGTSACEFIALYLKAHNIKRKDWVRKSYLKRLDKYKERCELIKQLATSINGTDGYIPPERRANEFDKKMGDFLALRRIITNTV